MHTAKSLASPANGQVFHPLACPILAHSLSSSSLSLRWRRGCLRLLLLVVALLVVVVVVADRGRRGSGDDDVAGEEVCARRSGRSWVARAWVADAHDGGCDGGEHCKGLLWWWWLVLMLWL
jgi:hypothetical protein